MIQNKGSYTATCPFNSTQGASEVLAMAGQNSGGFELRVTQEEYGSPPAPSVRTVTSADASGASE